MDSSQFQSTTSIIDAQTALTVFQWPHTKKASGRGGADNVLFDLETGDIISPSTGEIMGSLFD
jgi:hypothetical protein